MYRVVIYQDAAPDVPVGELTLSPTTSLPEQRRTSYTVVFNGEVVGIVDNYRDSYGPWKLAERALHAIFGSIQGDAVLPHKDRAYSRYTPRPLTPYSRQWCNGVTVLGKRCRFQTAPGSHFCPQHLWQVAWG